MAKVIIGIHGLGNKPTKEVLEQWWKQAMVEGLAKSKKPYQLPHFEMVYWADILYDRPMDELILDKEDPYFLVEKYTRGFQNVVPEDLSMRRKVLNFLEDQLDKIFLNGDLTTKYTGITNAFIHRYFTDLEVYYAEECVDKNDIRCTARKLIRERLVAALEKYKDDEILLIGHSMGSIVAYDVLTFLTPDIDIHTFITLGSPLGFPVVQGKIATEWNSKRLVPPILRTPPRVKTCWYNFADLKDNVALIYQLSKNFKANWRGVKPKDYVVNNDYQINNEANHHKSFGYLRTRAFARVLHKFSTRENLAKNILSIFYSFFQK